MSDLLELADRCEAATGPDLALNDDIARTLLSIDGRLWSGLSKPYTASIDAAMTLAGDVSGIELAENSVGRWNCALSNSSGDGLSGAATMPLAICAAALRARSEAAAVGGR